MSLDVSFDFDQYPTLLRMANSDTFFKMVLGPAGSAKTSGLSMMALRAAVRQAPSPDGVRRTKTMVVRTTYQQLLKNTIPSWRTILGGVATINNGTPPSGKAVFPLEDGTTVEWLIEFMALDSPNASNDILGAEMTNIVLDEVASMESEAMVLALLSRVGRYPSAKFGGPTKTDVWGSTNGPKKSHWLYEWVQGSQDKFFSMMEVQSKRKYFELFRQPAGLVQDADGVWQPHPDAENIANLFGGYNYYYAQLVRSKQDIQAYVQGEFSDLQSGKVVYPAFRRDMHVTGYDSLMATWGKRGKIMLSFDFGRTPVCLVVIQNNGGGLIVIDEIMGEDVSVDGLWTGSIRPVLLDKYPRTELGNCVGDPAGADQMQATEDSPYSVLQKHGVPIQFPGGGRKDRLDVRIEAVRQRLTRLDTFGRPMLQITDNCKYLIDALASTYIYESVHGQKDTLRDTPTKTHAGWASDLANSLEYICWSLSEDMASVGAPRAVQRPMRPLLGG